MFSRNYSRLLELQGQVDELISCLSDPNLTDDQLFQAHQVLSRMLETTSQMKDSDDGHAEIQAILSRLDKAVTVVQRFRSLLDTRWRTTVDRALHVLNSVVSSRLSDTFGDSNVRQCLKSLDALLARRRKSGGDEERPKGTPRRRGRHRRFF